MKKPTKNTDRPKVVSVLKRKTTPKEEIVEPKENLFPKEDYYFVVNMRRVINPTHEECEKILELYRKYIQYVWGYTTGCNSCSTSISNLWNELNTFVVNNDAKFEK